MKWDAIGVLLGVIGIAFGAGAWYKSNEQTNASLAQRIDVITENYALKTDVLSKSNCRIVVGDKGSNTTWDRASKARCDSEEIAIGGGCSVGHSPVGAIGRLLDNKLQGYECIISHKVDDKSLQHITAQAVCCS